MQMAGFLTHLCSTCPCPWSFFMLRNVPGLLRLLGLAFAATSAWNVLSHMWPVYFCSSPNGRTQDALSELLCLPHLNFLCLLFWFRAPAPPASTVPIYRIALVVHISHLLDNTVAVTMAKPDMHGCWIHICQLAHQISNTGESGPYGSLENKLDKNMFINGMRQDNKIPSISLGA